MLTVLGSGCCLQEKTIMPISRTTLGYPILHVYSHVFEVLRAKSRMTHKSGSLLSFGKDSILEIGSSLHVTTV